MKQCNGPRQANLVLIAYASSEGSGEPAHPRSLARIFAARSYKQWVKRNLQTESQIPGPSEWLGMRSYNLSWRNARRHKFAWRGSNNSEATTTTNQKTQKLKNNVLLYAYFVLYCVCACTYNVKRKLGSLSLTTLFILHLWKWGLCLLIEKRWLKNENDVLCNSILD